METMKETAATIGASAKSGMEKTKATVQGTVEKMSTRDPMMKDAAEMKKQDRIMQAEAQKQQEIHNATAGTHSYSTTGETGMPTGMHQMSAVPGHGTGQPTGQVVGGVAQSHPIGTNKGTQMGHNTHVGGGTTGTGGSCT